MISGRCECGNIQFKAKLVDNNVTACHCSQCRRTSGHYWACVHALQDDLIFEKDESLVWYQSSDFARRGFCGVCGSSLFYAHNDAKDIAIAAGSLQDTEKLALKKHIFVKDKGKYYDIGDEAEHVQKY